MLQTPVPVLATENKGLGADPVGIMAFGQFVVYREDGGDVCAFYRCQVCVLHSRCVSGLI